MGALGEQHMQIGCHNADVIDLAGPESEAAANAMRYGGCITASVGSLSKPNSEGNVKAVVLAALYAAYRRFV
jgi:hypothetical protein